MLRIFRSALPLLLIALCAHAAPQSSSTPSTRLRYHFVPGDHLVYNETAERHIDGPGRRIHTRATFTSHVLVLQGTVGRYSIGFQRGRQSADLLSFTENGKDRLATETPKFREQNNARGSMNSESNMVDLLGQPFFFWSAARESSSRYLLAVHEIEAVPEKAVAPGDQWTGLPPLSWKFRFERFEQLGGEKCALVAGQSASALHLKYWFCPDSGLMRKVEYHGEYDTFAGKAIETITFELQERRSKEALSQWLADTNTRQAALRALLLDEAFPVDDTTVEPALRSSDTTTQSLALAVLYRRRMKPQHNKALIDQLAHSSDPQVARIAARVLSPASTVAATQTFAANTPGTSLRYMKSSGYEGYPYILHVPPDYRGDTPFPLIVYLTGGPGIAMDGANGAEPAIANTGYLVVYPHAGGRMWWEDQSKTMVDHLLQELSTALNIKPGGIYITGFSNGGSGAAYYANAWPSRFGGMVSLMGAASCLSDLGPLHYDKLSSLPILLVHGDKDDIIPYHCSEDFYQALRKHHTAELELKILKGHGHDITLSTDDGLTLGFIDRLNGANGNSHEAAQ